MDLTFRTTVEVTKGFYKGQQGIILGYKRWFFTTYYRVELNYPPEDNSPTSVFVINPTNRIKIWVKKTSLREALCQQTFK